MLPIKMRADLRMYVTYNVKENVYFENIFGALQKGENQGALKPGRLECLAGWGLRMRPFDVRCWWWCAWRVEMRSRRPSARECYIDISGRTQATAAWDCVMAARRPRCPRRPSGRAPHLLTAVQRPSVEPCPMPRRYGNHLVIKASPYHNRASHLCVTAGRLDAATHAPPLLSDAMYTRGYRTCQYTLTPPQLPSLKKHPK